jgi:hypothetical protein
MVKTYAKCKLCGTNKFLNHAQLCKSCNKKPESRKIIEDVLEKRHNVQIMQKEMKQRELEEAAKHPEPEAEEGEEGEPGDGEEGEAGEGKGDPGKGEEGKDKAEKK